LYSFQYSKVISTVVSAALLVGLQIMMMADPAAAETRCHRASRAAGAAHHWRQARADDGQGCAARARKNALARDQASFQQAYAEVGATAAPAEANEAAARAQASEAAAHAQAQAQVSEALDEQRPNAPRCVAAPGEPFRRGPWELGIDRATGHRCWRLVGTIKPHVRIASRAKPPHAPKPAAPSPRLGAASAGSIAMPAAADAHRPVQPSELPTGTVAKPSKPQPVNLGQSLASAADTISKPNEVDRGELPLFDQRFARTADPGSFGTSAALVATAADDARMSGGSMLEQAAAVLSVLGRPAVFLIIFFSMLAAISACYVLVIGCLKLLRPRRRRQSAPAIGMAPRRYLGAMEDRNF